MNVIRDIFSILFILCALCLQFDLVHVQASENDQMRETSPVSPRPDKPLASSYVKASQLQESSMKSLRMLSMSDDDREVNLSVKLTTTSTTKNEIDERRKIARKKKSKKLHNRLKDFNRTVTLSTTKTEVEGSKKITRKAKSEKLLNKHKESSPNTTRKDIEERGESARKTGDHKISNQNGNPSGKVDIDTKIKNSEASGESTRKRENQERLSHKNPSGEVDIDTKIKNSEESGESTRKRENQERLSHSEESQISNEDSKEIAEQKNNEVDQESRKQYYTVNPSDNIETTSPWPKKSNLTNTRYHKRGRSPMFMRQQKKSADDNKDDDEDPEPERLNVYSLREDMMKMLSSIKNINASVGVIGRTAEYNDIVLCKISEHSKAPKKLRPLASAKAEDDKYTDEETEKKIIFIVHGLSAMGFNAVPCLYEQKQFMKLLQFYTEYLDKFDIYLIPIANPDGTSDNQPLSNKNKSPQTACSGVALDRNFDVSWNAFHVNSCHQQYPGPSAFSEPESRAVGDILHQFNDRIAAYINVHAGSYSAEVFKGDAVLYPKGFVEFNTDDDKYMDIKGEIDEALRIAGFKVMSVTVDTLYNWYGKVTGTSVDYASSVYGIPYAMEFVMQPYQDSVSAASTEKTSENVLTEIWKRVFDVVFTNIHRNNQNNEVNK